MVAAAALLIETTVDQALIRGFPPSVFPFNRLLSSAGQARRAAIATRLLRLKGDGTTEGGRSPDQETSQAKLFRR
jgi:hypothetical protein